MMNLRAAWIAAVLLLCACGGGGGIAPVTSSDSPASSSIPSAASTPAVVSDDWTTYAHDNRLTGYEAQSTGITNATASQLTLAWRAAPASNCATATARVGVIADEASPLVANGSVYYADACGNVAALDAATGATKWRTAVPNVPAAAGAEGTPTLDLARNLLIVPMHGSDPGTCFAPNSPCNTPASDGFLVALDATSGQIRWMQPPLTSGNLRGEPIVINGVIYEGLAGGDAFSGGTDGGIFALNEMTGTPVAGTSIPMVQAAPLGEQGDGGGSWSPISYDGGNTLYFGFGNTVNNDGLQDSVAALNIATHQLSPNFSLATFDHQSEDEDIGGGEMLWGGNLYFEGKNGQYYGYSLAAPTTPLVDAVVNTDNGNGAIWTPTTDGSVVAVSSGYATLKPQFSSYLYLFSMNSSTPKCSLHATESALYSYAAWVSGVGFTVLDSGSGPAVVAFDENCNIIWSAKQTDLLAFFYGGPAVVPSGLYAIDNMGNVYSWKLPSQMTSTVRRAAANRAFVRPGVSSRMRMTEYMRHQ